MLGVTVGSLNSPPESQPRVLPVRLAGVSTAGRAGSGEGRRAGLCMPGMDVFLQVEGPAGGDGHTWVSSGPAPPFLVWDSHGTGSFWEEQVLSSKGYSFKTMDTWRRKQQLRTFRGENRQNWGRGPGPQSNRLGFRTRLRMTAGAGDWASCIQ